MGAGDKVQESSHGKDFVFILTIKGVHDNLNHFRFLTENELSGTKILAGMLGYFSSLGKRW